MKQARYWRSRRGNFFWCANEQGSWAKLKNHPWHRIAPIHLGRFHQMVEEGLLIEITKEEAKWEHGN